ncbi:MAG: hypothetical protein EXR66_08935 [Dehalococcoidia bacterium]|nr:hypothetical protein [Dehalococcoidia bacterium]
MANHDQIIAAIEDADMRVEELWGRILEHGDTPLAEGTWRVRDALSHLAARANGVARVMARARALKDPNAPQPPAPTSIDDINAGQVADRSGKSVRELLDEITEGHRHAIIALREVTRDELREMIPMGFRPEEIEVGDSIIRGGPAHDHGHLDQIQAVLPTA